MQVHSHKQSNSLPHNQESRFSTVLFWFSTDFDPKLSLWKNIAHMSTYHWVLVGMWGEVLESPLHVLVGGQHAGELGRLVAAKPEQAVVGRQHDPVKDYHLLVIMVSPG